MYYLIYAVIYLISLLPLFILYRISDFLFLIIYHLSGYRKDIVMKNLETAFPELNENQRMKITRDFYRCFCDSFVEIVKLFSISEKQLRRRVSMDLSICDPIITRGKNIHFLLGHQINWEYGNLINVLVSSIPTINIYLRLKSKVANRLIYTMRSRFGGNLVSVQNFRAEAAAVMKNQYSMGLIADQSPANGEGSYWLYFLGRPTAFIMGPEKTASKLNPSFVFLDCKRIKRGYYRYEAHVIAENGKDLSAGELTRRYRSMLEKSIREHPENYLWTHRRWKLSYKKEYANNWIDKAAPPES